MQKLYQKFKDDDFEILAVSIDALGAGVVAPFMQKYSLTFPALLDSKGTIRESYGATGIPESFIIDRQGILVKKIIGAADWSSPEVFRYFRELIQRSWSQNQEKT
jgi:peroxiredoxin